MNEITEKQNTERSLNFIAASRYTYSCTKNLIALQMVCTVLVPIVSSVVAILYPHYKVWSAVYGILIAVVDILLFDNLQKEWKKRAAKIQEQVDCELFELEWNEFKVGDKPLPENVYYAVQRYRKKDPDLNEVKNWYSVKIAPLPLYQARIICQRTNIRWDSDLRRGYAIFLQGLMWTIIVAGFVAGLALRMDMERFVLSVMASIFPTIQWLLREIKRQRESAVTLDRLVTYVQRLWTLVLTKQLSPEQATAQSRALQDELFTHRSSNQPIFDWVYSRFKTRNHILMNVAAEDLVNQALSVGQQQ